MIENAGSRGSRVCAVEIIAVRSMFCVSGEGRREGLGTEPLKDTSPHSEVARGSL